MDLLQGKCRFIFLRIHYACFQTKLTSFPIPPSLVRTQTHRTLAQLPSIGSRVPSALCLSFVRHLLLADVVCASPGGETSQPTREREKRRSTLIRTKGDFELKLRLNGKAKKTHQGSRAVMEREKSSRNSTPEAALGFKTAARICFDFSRTY